MYMHGLKKTGITIVAGGLIGASATVALGATELYGVGDMGNFNSPMPDGNADGVFINTLFNTVDIVYYDDNGLNIVDTSGELVDVLVTSPGSGYGQNTNGDCRIMRWVNNASPIDTAPADEYPAGWFVWAEVNNNGTGGTGAEALYQLDGPAGGYFYSGAYTYGTFDYFGFGSHGRTVRYGAAFDTYYDHQDFGMLRITNGGTGYWPGHNGNGAPGTTTLPHGGNDNGACGGAGNFNREGSLHFTITNGESFGVAGDTLFEEVFFPFGTFNVNHNPASGARNVTQWGPTPVFYDGFFNDGNYMVGNVNNTVKEMWIINDNVTWAPTAGHQHNKSHDDQWGNYRLYLGHNPPTFNGNMTSMVNMGWDLASAAGEVCDLDIIPNSTGSADHALFGIDTNSNRNDTSGIGYTAGNFIVRDANGDVVSGVTISYEVDSDGRIYCNGKGSFQHGARSYNVNSVTGGPNNFVLQNGNTEAHGWMITNKGSGHHQSTGWTLEPANTNSGFGFDCRGVHLWGQVVNLPTMSCHTAGANAWDVTTVPTITIAVNANNNGSMVPSSTSQQWSYSHDDVPTGHVVDGYVWNGGSSYTSAPASWITTQSCETGTGAVLTGVIGGVGRRTITMGGEDVSTDLFNNGFKCYTNGDFNGDGYSDLLWHSDDAEITAIWNMGPEGMIKSAGFIQPESMGPGWSFGGIGKFGYSGTGCCIFWHNVFDGQTAVWVIDSSHANEIDWIVGGVFLDTVELLSNTPRVTNNVVQNGGTGVYWQDELIGQLAYWPIAVNTNISGASIAGAGFITLDGLELLFPFDFGINVAGVGNMAGRPVSEGTSSLRDIVSVNDITGETLVWLMSSDHTSINTSAVGNTGATGGGYTTRLGLVTFDNFYNFEGIGQYNVWATYAIPPGAGFLPGGPLRQTWFANLFWSNPDVASNFSWKMDRNIDLLDYSVTPAAPTGTGLLGDPYEIIGTAPLD